LLVTAEDFKEIDEAGVGSIVAATGLKVSFNILTSRLLRFYSTILYGYMVI